MLTPAQSHMQSLALLLQGSLMVDSTGFRTGGNENAASIIQRIGREDLICRIAQRVTQIGHMYDCKTYTRICDSMT